MPVEYVAGDLFLSGAQALAHGCNCRGRMGAGIAVEFKRRFPEMYHEYRRRCRAGEFTPGNYYLEKATQPWVLNLATQSTKAGAQQEFIETCFHSLAERYAEEGITSIAMPRIAAGLGGLRWQDVKLLIDEILGPLPIPIHVFEEFVEGVAPAEGALDHV